MVEMVRKHTVEGTGNHRTIMSCVQRTQDMLREVKQISRSFVRITIIYLPDNGMLTLSRYHRPTKESRYPWDHPPLQCTQATRPRTTNMAKRPKSTEEQPPKPEREGKRSNTTVWNMRLVRQRASRGGHWPVFEKPRLP